MANPYSPPDSGPSETDQSDRVRKWQRLWLIGLGMPFLLLFSFGLLLNGVELSYSATLLITFGPFVLGLFVSFVAFGFGQLSVAQTAMLTAATLVLYQLGFGLFALLIAVVFGITAT